MTGSSPMILFVPFKRVIDYNVKVRVKADRSGERATLKCDCC